MYRPNNWDEIVRRECYDGEDVYKEVDAFEDGADAIIGALRKEAVSVQRATELWQSTTRGVIVFIPDEVKNGR